jgi:hypothetical protein
MKTRKLTLALAALLITSAAFVSSCKKKTTEDKDTDTTAASDNNQAESTSNDVTTMAGQASEHGSLSSYKGGANYDVSALTCADTITYDSTNKKIRVHFSGTTCRDNRTRSGAITFDYSGSTLGAKFYRNPGYKVHITTQNYMVDGNAVSIDKTITNNGFNASNNLNWTVTANVSITRSAANGGGTINWSCTRTHALMNTSAAYTIGTSTEAPCYVNQSTPIDWTKSVVKVDGSASGTSAKGVAYTLSANGLFVDMNCSPSSNPFRHPIIQGSIDFTPTGKVTRHVDFGNGSCDMLYTVTIAGTTYGPYSQ